MTCSLNLRNPCRLTDWDEEDVFFRRQAYAIRQGEKTAYSPDTHSLCKLTDWDEEGIFSRRQAYEIRRGGKNALFAQYAQSELILLPCVPLPLQ